MDRERYDYVRVQSEQGRDVFVRNPETGEEGLVERCADDKVYVCTAVQKAQSAAGITGNSLN